MRAETASATRCIAARFKIILWLNYVVQKHKLKYGLCISASRSTFQEKHLTNKSHSYFPPKLKVGALLFLLPNTHTFLFFFFWHFPALQLQKSLLVSNPALAVSLKLWEQARQKLNTLDIFNECSVSGDFSHFHKLLLVAWNLNLMHIFFFFARPTEWTLCLRWNILPLGLLMATGWLQHTQGDWGLWEGRWSCSAWCIFNAITHLQWELMAWSSVTFYLFIFFSSFLVQPRHFIGEGYICGVLRAKLLHLVFGELSVRFFTCLSAACICLINPLIRRHLQTSARLLWEIL